VLADRPPVPSARPVAALGRAARRLRARFGPQHPTSVDSTLLVPVFAAETTVGSFRNHLDPASRLGIPPHVTVLFPWAPLQDQSAELIDALTDLFSRFQPFDFSLSTTGWFGERVLYLRPDPSDNFVRLTTGIADRFTQYPPYRGAFAEVIPHLTIGEDAELDALRSAEIEVRERLPITARATEVWLMSATSSGPWANTRTFSLGRREG
jgi:2'-5' RNA ligase